MAEQYLDHANVDPALEKMGGEAVPQDVHRDLLADARRGAGRPAGRVQHRRLDRPACFPPREQPVCRAGKPPIGPQDAEQLRGEHDVALLAALAVLDVDQHAPAVDVAHPEAGHLRDAQPGRVGGRQCRARLQARHGLEKPHHLVGAQHHRQPARLAGIGDPLRDLRHTEGHAVKEPQRRNRLVQARPRHALRGEVHLEGPHVLQRQFVRGTSEKPTELRNRMYVGSLRRRREVADRHVLDHAAAKRADLGHRIAPVWKGSRQPKPSSQERPRRSTSLPRSGFVQSTFLNGL